MQGPHGQIRARGHRESSTLWNQELDEHPTKAPARRDLGWIPALHVWPSGKKSGMWLWSPTLLTMPIVRWDPQAIRFVCSPEERRAGGEDDGPHATAHGPKTRGSHSTQRARTVNYAVSSVHKLAGGAPCHYPLLKDPELMPAWRGKVSINTGQPRVTEHQAFVLLDLRGHPAPSLLITLGLFTRIRSGIFSERYLLKYRLRN